MPDLVIQIFWITPRTNFKYFQIKAYLNLDLDPNLKLALNYNLFKKYDFFLASQPKTWGLLIKLTLY